ncbi:ABCBA protein, partial [Atractosteus spatula]|nr:ABCBA protein [Atractosteus spatula]
MALRPEQLKGELEFRDVTFSYPTRKDAPIFRGLSLSVPAGSVMAVVGPSGSGKSTLVSLLLRLYDPDSGVIAVDGYDIRDLNPYCLRSNIGTVSQEPVLFSGSIAENIAYGAPDPSRVSAQDIHRAAQIANAHGFVQHFPRGYDTVVGEKGVLLSGGQKQRIAIARAVLKNPKILLLDEATSALDAENEFLVQEALDRLMQGRTVLIIAHRLSTIQNADAVAVLDQQRVVECGRHEELLANRQGLFRKLVEKQAFLQNSQKHVQPRTTSLPVQALQRTRCLGAGQSATLEKTRGLSRFGGHGSRRLSDAKTFFLLKAIRHRLMAPVDPPPSKRFNRPSASVASSNGSFTSPTAPGRNPLASSGGFHSYSTSPPREEAILVCPSGVVDCIHLSSAALGFLVISSTVTMSAPFFLGRVVDTINSSPAQELGASLTGLCAVLSGVFLCGAAANTARLYLIDRAGLKFVSRCFLFAVAMIKTWNSLVIILSGQQIVRNLRGSLFNSILRQEVGFFDKTRTGELINRLSADTVVIGHSITDNLFYMSPKLAAFVLMIVPPLAVLAVVYGRYLRSLSKRTQDALAESTQVATTSLAALLKKNSCIYNYKLSCFSSFYSGLMKGFGAGVRLWELLDRKPEFPLSEGMALRPEQLKGELEFRDVTFSYPTRKDAPIFRGLSLSVPAGSVMAVVGPSGSGKSTLVSLLLRLYDPDSGSLAVDGYDLRDLNPQWLRSFIGTVSQEPVLFSGSIAENIAYGAPDPSRVSAQDIRRAAQIANAHGFVQHFPRGYDTMVGEKGVLLSGKRKQRIAIARALLKNPKILLLDEATSALDTENEFLVQEALDRLMQGRTVLIIAHRLSTIQNADAVAVLDQQRVVECGRHEELLANRQGLFRKLVEKQAFLQNSQKHVVVE